MFEKKAEEYREKGKREGYYLVSQEMEQEELDYIIDESFKDGAEFGYNKGYHDAEEHYINVIDNQHKLVDESKKKDFKKCIKCTDGTYQYGFKDGYNKANEWHKADEKPKVTKEYLVYLISGYNCRSVTMMIYNAEHGFWCADNQNDVVKWKEIVLPEESE